MSKVLKIIGIIIIVGVVVYGFFILFVSPSTNNDKITLTRDFYNNITEEDICETHFNSETKAFCVTYQGLLEDEVFTIDEVATQGTGVVVTITIDDNSEDFSITFIEEVNTGIKGFFHKTNYYIDIIE